jgi:hypothetical protein
MSKTHGSPPADWECKATYESISAEEGNCAPRWVLAPLVTDALMLLHLLRNAATQTPNT